MKWGQCERCNRAGWCYVIDGELICKVDAEGMWVAGQQEALAGLRFGFQEMDTEHDGWNDIG